MRFHRIIGEVARFSLLLAWLFSMSFAGGAHAEELRVMTFNIWVGGEEGKQPLEQTAKVIRSARADIVGVQEAYGFEVNGHKPNNGARLAKLLGWHYFDQGGTSCILSRHPIVANTPKRRGVTVRLPSGREVQMFNTHLMHIPYQPYQLLNIPYGDGRFIKTAAEAEDEARKARGDQVRQLVAELKPALESGQPVFLTGDFNEPSHLDWTERAARAGKCPLPVRYPSTAAIVELGFRDAYRTIFPDEVAKPGWTWTPTTSPTDPKDRHDRIDFVFFAGPITVDRCAVVGEAKQFADLVVKPYPSDHRAVVARFKLKR